MKKVMAFLFAAALFAACGKQSNDGNAEARDKDEQNSGETMSPQRDDSGNNAQADSTATNNDAGQQQESQPEGGGSDH
jgi:hypothetical protein